MEKEVFCGALLFVPVVMVIVLLYVTDFKKGR